MAFLKRSGTLQIHSDSKDLAIKVQKFLCHDEKTLGKSHKKWNWTFNLGGELQEWEVKVDEAVVGANTLEFRMAGKEMFKNKMQQDYEHKLPVRGGLKLEKAYEVKSMNSTDIWYPATLTEFRPDGKYEAVVTMPPDQYGESKKVHYPIVEANRIRDPFSKKLVEVPVSNINLLVKKDNALTPELTINGHNFASYICVPTPPKGKGPAEINFKVDKNRTMVDADVGHGQLKEALDPTRPDYKPKSKACKKTKLKSEWEIQIGSWGSHYIVAETKSKSSKEIQITIDDQLVVGGSAADLGSNEWMVDIAVQGKLTLKYQLHKTNANGVALEETQVVTKKLVHSNTIRVSVPDHTNLETATLECDEVEFSRLEQYKNPPSESKINGTLETLESTHGVQVPYVSGDGASSGNDFADLIPGGAGLLGMFDCCKVPDTAGDDSQLVIGPSHGSQ